MTALSAVSETTRVTLNRGTNCAFFIYVDTFANKLCLVLEIQNQVEFVFYATLFQRKRSLFTFTSSRSVVARDIGEKKKT